MVHICCTRAECLWLTQHKSSPVMKGTPTPRSNTRVILLLGNKHKKDIATRFLTAASLLGLGYDKLESLFVLAGGVCPIASSNFTLLNTTVANAVTKLCTISCDDQLDQMVVKGDYDFAADATYSSRGWHANEITVLLSNPQTKAIVARQHLMKHTGISFFYNASLETNGFVYSLGSQADQHPLRTYEGTATMAEGDGFELILKQLDSKVNLACVLSSICNLGSLGCYPYVVAYYRW